MRYLRHILFLGVLLGSVVDARKPHTPKKPPQKQDTSKATDWVAS
jgi:hypothetical protein